MIFLKEFDNKLRLIINKMDGALTVSVGVLVKTGSVNENAEENGISHFIEHTLFKGTKKRSAFEISDCIDRIGAQINAFTSKELTCYYTKSMPEHLDKSLDVLSDIFFNSVFDKEELEKEKGVVVEEINMCDDTPEDLCLDLLASNYFGNLGLGRPILGTEKTVKSFSKADIERYMDKYYTSDNTVISIAGNVDIDKACALVEGYFASAFSRKKSAPQFKNKKTYSKSSYKYKKIEQAHIGIAMKGIKLGEDVADSFAIANTVLGGGMSSRLFQKIREEMGLCYSVYSYASSYKDTGVLEIYAGVNADSRDRALAEIVNQVKNLKENGITEQEFLRGKQQVKSAFIMSAESTASQMLLYGKNLIYLNKRFSLEERLEKIDKITLKDVLDAIDLSFDTSSMSLATVGRCRKPL